MKKNRIVIRSYNDKSLTFIKGIRNQFFQTLLSKVKNTQCSHSHNEQFRVDIFEKNFFNIFIKNIITENSNMNEVF